MPRQQSTPVLVPAGTVAPGALVIPGATGWRVHVLGGAAAYQGATIQLYNTDGSTVSQPINSDFDTTIIGQWCYTGIGQGLRIATDAVNAFSGILVWEYVAP